MSNTPDRVGTKKSPLKRGVAPQEPGCVSPHAVSESPTLQRGGRGDLKSRQVLHLWKIMRDFQITAAVLARLFDTKGKYLRDVLTGHSCFSAERRRKIEAFLAFVKVPAAEIARAWEMTSVPARELRRPANRKRLEKLYQQVAEFNQQYDPTAGSPDHSSVDNIDLEVRVFERSLLPVAASKWFDFTDRAGNAVDPFWQERKDPNTYPPFQYPGYIAAYEELLRAASLRALFALIAPPASGKTYLLERAKLELRRRGYMICEPRLLTKSKLTEGDVLNAILGEIAGDQHVKPRHKIAARTEQIFNLLTVEGQGMRKVALVLDEAQDLPAEALRVIKRLHDWHYGVYDNLISPILVGHPLLRANLRTSLNLDEVGKRTVFHELAPIQDIFTFLDWRLAATLGRPFSSRGLFTPEGAARFEAEVNDKPENLARPLALCNLASQLCACAAELEEKQISDHVIVEVANQGRRS